MNVLNNTVKLTRVLVWGANPIVRMGLKQVFGSADDIAVVGETADLELVQTTLDMNTADVALVDTPSLDWSKVEAMQRALTENVQVSALVMVTQANVLAATRLFRGSARGYVAKESEVDVLLAATRCLAAGNRFIDPRLAESMFFGEPISQMNGCHLLSKRELEVLQYLAQGYSLSYIGKALDLSVKTVSTHKRRLMQKLHLDSNANLVRFALKIGIVPI